MRKRCCRDELTAGFTLIELMIVIAVIAIIASIAIPNLIASRIVANEKATIATLRTIGSGMEQFRAGGHLDLDHDGQGEYGAIIELSGNLPVRGTTSFLDPPILSRTFGSPDPNGKRQMKGYVFMMWLPGPGGVGLAEQSANVPFFDPDLSSTCWCIYAWPVDAGTSGRHCYFLNQTGEILQTTDPNYSGLGVTIPAGSAFTGGDPARIDRPGLASGVVGNDNNVWRSIGS